MSPVRNKPGIGPSLRVLRLALGWSQTELHRRTGLLRGEISSIEIGQNLGSSWRVRELLAKGLGLPSAILNSYFEEKLTLEDLLTRIHANAATAGTARAEPKGAQADYFVALPNLHLAARLVAKRFKFDEEIVKNEALRLAMSQDDPALDLDTLEWTQLLEAALKNLQSKAQVNPLRIPNLVTAIRLLAQENPKEEPRIKEIAARVASGRDEPKLIKTVEWFRALDEEFKRELQGAKGKPKRPKRTSKS